MHLLCETNLDNLELDSPVHSVLTFIVAHTMLIKITPQLNCEILQVRGWCYDAVIFAFPMPSPVPGTKVAGQ